MASGQWSLLCDSYEVYGLGGVLPSYDGSAEDAFTVRFAKQFVWDLFHRDDRLMHVRYGVPTVTVPQFPEDTLRAMLTRVLRVTSADVSDRLTALARCAGAQAHGCMLVVSGDAVGEAERLESQCTRVAPFPLTAENLPAVTAIDGSVLIDTNGTCHAVGVILDGEASPKCSPERGARYNSAVRYAYGRRNCVAVVKSEDGMVNVFPNLRPRIRRSEIGKRLAELRVMAGSARIDTYRLIDVVRWLEEHEFYLTAAECDEANRLHDEAAAKVSPDDFYSRRLGPLAPNPDMDDSYYLPE
jgi:hypothetical protein